MFKDETSSLSIIIQKLGDGHDHRREGISFKENRMSNIGLSYLYPHTSGFIEVRMQINITLCIFVFM